MRGLQTECHIYLQKQLRSEWQIRYWIFEIRSIFIYMNTQYNIIPLIPLFLSAGRPLSRHVTEPGGRLFGGRTSDLCRRPPLRHQERVSDCSHTLPCRSAVSAACMICANTQKHTHKNPIFNHDIPHCIWISLYCCQLLWCFSHNYFDLKQAI